MRNVIVSEFLSLDGVLQAPGGPEEDLEGGFEHGGWQIPYVDEIAATAVSEGMDSSDALLLGRKTYEIFAAYWPSATDEDGFADRMNGIDKFVASRSLEEAEWENSTVLEGDVEAAVAELKRQPGRDIRVLGSGDLARTLMRHDLVDEYQLMVHPVVLGSGKRLFGDADEMSTLRLVDSETTGTGVVILTYRPAEKNGTETTETSLTITRTFDAPRERVYRAFADPDELEEWYNPGDATTTVHALELEPDGELSLSFGDGESGTDIEGTFLEVLENERIVHTWRYPGEEVSRLTYEFRDVDDGTEVVLVHERIGRYRDASAGEELSSRENVDAYVDGWSGALGTLETLLRREEDETR